MPNFKSSRTPGGGLFLQMDRAKAEARAKGVHVIDLSVGSSDLPPPREALDALKAAVDDKRTYGYCLKSTTMPFLQSATDWYKRRYDIGLDPTCEALALVGSQEGLAHLLLAVAEQGDGVLMTNPYYPSYSGAVQVAGLVPLYLPLGSNLLPDFSKVPAEHASKARVLLLNYPNNPTGISADTAFFQRALKFAEDHDLLLVHDNPYIDQVYGDTPAPSPLALPGACNRVIELFSFSKSFHLGGFRVGFALGCREAIASLEAVKAPIDFNQYVGMLRMGVACLRLPEERLRADAAIWRGRAATMVRGLCACGWQVNMPAAGMYIWARLPEGLDDLEFCLQLVAATGVALSPGQGFGPGGTGFVRIALVQPEGILLVAAQKIASLLKQQLGDSGSDEGEWQMEGDRSSDEDV